MNLPPVAPKSPRLPLRPLRAGPAGSGDAEDKLGEVLARRWDFTKILFRFELDFRRMLLGFDIGFPYGFQSEFSWQVFRSNLTAGPPGLSEELPRRPGK